MDEAFPLNSSRTYPGDARPGRDGHARHAPTCGTTRTSSISVLRPANVLGCHVRSAIGRYLRADYVPTVHGLQSDDAVPPRGRHRRGDRAGDRARDARRLQRRRPRRRAAARRRSRRSAAPPLPLPEFAVRSADLDSCFAGASTRFRRAPSISPSTSARWTAPASARRPASRRASRWPRPSPRCGRDRPAPTAAARRRTHGRTSRIPGQPPPPAPHRRRRRCPRPLPRAVPRPAAGPAPRRATGLRELLRRSGVDELWEQLNPDVVSDDQRRDRGAPAPHADAGPTSTATIRGGSTSTSCAGAGRHHPALPLLLPRRDASASSNLPDGRVLVISNHAGQVALDAAMIGTATVLEREPPRIVRGMGEYWLPTVPFVNLLMSRTGSVVGTPKNCIDLLRNERSGDRLPRGRARHEQAVQRALSAAALRLRLHAPGAVDARRRSCRWR